MTPAFRETGRRRAEVRHPAATALALHRNRSRAHFIARTKAVLSNNPLNSCGIVYGREELEMVASFCVRHDAIAICDEVWERVIVNGRAHLPMIAMPGMGGRAVTIGAAGKTCSLTRWKVGLVAACSNIMPILAKADQFLPFKTPPNLQVALAYGLMKDDSYFTSMRANFQRICDRFSAGLEARGFTILPCQGTYFVSLDIAPLGAADAIESCKRLIGDFGVAAVPVSVFCAEDAVGTVVRFCFASRDATGDSAIERVAQAGHAWG